ncbi:MAG: retinol dehydrogenase [Xanthomonadaceae bacterium]|nr:retinol dehydrogenase [Xanthomonadaceae bacterium]
MLTLPLTRERVLDRPIADCFRYLADFSTTEQWDPGVFEADKRTPGPARAGSTFALRLNVLGRSVPADYRLIERDEDRRLVLEGSGPGFTVVDTLDFEALGPARTRLRYQAVMRWDAVPARIAPLLRPWAERLGDQAMTGLTRALVEDGPEQLPARERLAQKLLLPGMVAFTRRGWRTQHSRGLSRRMDGRTVAITGVTAGLGLAAAKELARLGARLILIGRGADRLTAAMQAIRDFAGDAELLPCEAELSSLADTQRLAERLLAELPAIDVLINNAGALFAERGDTPEGHERTLAINLLSPALLCKRLEPMLAERRGRVVNVVSGGLYLQGLALDDLDYQRGDYDGSKAYARAKRGLLALTRLWAEDEPRIAWHAMHPGWAATPGVAKSLPGFDRRMQPFLRTPRQGADTMVWLASHPAVAAHGDDSSGFWFDRAQRPDALLPGTAVDTPTAMSLEAEVRLRGGW